MTSIAQESLKNVVLAWFEVAWTAQGQAEASADWQRDRRKRHQAGDKPAVERGRNILDQEERRELYPSQVVSHGWKVGFA